MWRAILGRMGRSRAVEFPHGLVSVAGALALHAGLGWVLMGGAAVAERPRAPLPALVWLESSSGDSSPPRVGLAGEPPAVVARPAARATSPSRPSAPLAPARSASFVAPAPPNATAAAAEPERVGLTPAPVPVSALAMVGGAPSAGGEPRALSGGSGGMGAGAGGIGQGGAEQHRSPASGSRAHLLGAGNPCSDLFPYAASSDSGTVAVALAVASSGQPLEPQIVEETPRGQGFALAARHCVRRLRFSPAFDPSGHAVASRSLVRLRFDRRSERARAAL